MSLISKIIPVFSRCYKAIVRILFILTLSARIHAIYEKCEWIVGIYSLRIILSDATGCVQCMVLEWAAQHLHELIEDWNKCRMATPAQLIEPRRYFRTFR